MFKMAVFVFVFLEKEEENFLKITLGRKHGRQ